MIDGQDAEDYNTEVEKEKDSSSRKGARELMNKAPFTAEQIADLDRRAERTAQRIREALQDRLTFTPEERQLLAYFRDLDASGRQCLLMQLKAHAARRPQLTVIEGGSNRE